MTASTRQPDWPPAGILGASSPRLPQPDARPAVLVLVDEYHTGLLQRVAPREQRRSLGIGPPRLEVLDGLPGRAACTREIVSRPLGEHSGGTKLERGEHGRFGAATPVAARQRCARREGGPQGRRARRSSRREGPP